MGRTHSGYSQFVVAQKSYASGHADIVEEVRHGRTAGHRLYADPPRRQQDKTVLAVAQKALPGVPAKVLEGSSNRWTGRPSPRWTPATWNTTTAFIDAIGALPDGAKGHHERLDQQVPAMTRPARKRKEQTMATCHRHAREHDRGRGRDRTTPQEQTTAGATPPPWWPCARGDPRSAWSSGR